MIFYVINLARAADRWAYMHDICARRGIRLTRIEAVDGLTLDEAAVAAHRPVAGERAMSRAEIACFESHRLAWRAIAEGADRHGCVLEDDVYLAHSIGPAVQEIAERFPEIDLVKLNAHRTGLIVEKAPIGRAGGRVLYRPSKPTIDASAYIISKRHAIRVLDAFRGYSEAVDLMLFDPASCRSVAQVSPAMAVQAKFAEFSFMSADAAESSIQVSRAVRRRLKRDEGPRRSIVQNLGAEMRRFHRRRIVPHSLAVLNLFKTAAYRRAFRRIGFAEE